MEQLGRPERRKGSANSEIHLLGSLILGQPCGLMARGGGRMRGWGRGPSDIRSEQEGGSELWRWQTQVKSCIVGRAPHLGGPFITHL